MARPSGEDPRLERLERRVSAVLALAAVLLMVAGAAMELLSTATWARPGAPGLLPAQLWRHWSSGLAIMSIGAIVLGLVPVVRVAVATWVYARRRSHWDLLVALVLLGELLFSMYFVS